MDRQLEFPDHDVGKADQGALAQGLEADAVDRMLHRRPPLVRKGGAASR